ncbi:ArsR family transcriptional regulator [Paenibacillus albiflavus]|uniref:ArsR family transcriptional regulator n=1 Tax=Paenibacillus albiflavus TaxID=2545760 RepID=A0A4R4E1H0_9BACL|nr:metalloregulator ArsR/SmtB family transcription factor [Paenibacillus albiflavus]TCZ73199.1 ArsR family transcriptional regulator [Paenibacillus albiflavus]
MTDIYRAIADPIRRQILLMTAQKECTQSEIVSVFTISQPAIIKHLTILKEEGLLEERRSGRYCFYRLNQSVFRNSYSNLQQELGAILEQKLVNLKLFLEKDDDQ